MKKNNLLFGFSFLAIIAIVVASCQKDVAPAPVPSIPTPVKFSFSEEFDDVGDLAAKGWLITNNSNPTGATAWRQGRYENNIGGSKAGKVIGMPAFSANNSPYDYISVDATCVNNAGAINCWLITPQTTVKNGDILRFYTRAMNDADWSNYGVDNMQVRANFVDGSTDCGSTSADFGNFTTLLTDINPNFLRNDPAGNTPAVPGYPRTWTLRTITISGLAAPTKARFGFRYLSETGVTGGLGGTKATSLIGIDKLEFISN
jgi:hypothetical protein